MHLNYIVNNRIDVPIGFLPGNPESHVIVCNGIDSFNENISISLEDLQENITTNLRVDSAYTYFASPSNDPNRFVLHINANTVDIEEFDEPIENLIYVSNRSIVVENTQGKTLDGEIKVFDLLGRLQFNENLGGSTKQIFEPFLRSGTYIVMICDNTDIQTEKIIIK